MLDALEPGGDFVVANANLGERVEHCGGVTAYLPAPTDEISPYYKDLRSPSVTAGTSSCALPPRGRGT